MASHCEDHVEAYPQTVAGYGDQRHQGSANRAPQEDALVALDIVEHGLQHMTSLTRNVCRCLPTGEPYNAREASLLPLAWHMLHHTAW